ncbi:MAG: hydrogenase maturation protease [Candidatus Zixiibacteriota bacterium]|nr:MAG: hydrogenase maturation protease [candidate division Zixibacteria bacterium]
MKPLVLGLGNDLLSDDGVGLLAAQRLQKLLVGKADVVASSLHGLALLDFFSGYKQAIVIDAIQLRKSPPGTIVEMDLSDLRVAPGPSPHYTGLRDLARIAGELKLAFPDEIRIFAVEAANTTSIGGGLCAAVSNALEEIIARVIALVTKWDRPGLNGKEQAEQPLVAEGPH